VSLPCILFLFRNDCPLILNAKQLQCT